jgi:hypothetical protein
MKNPCYWLFLSPEFDLFKIVYLAEFCVITLENLTWKSVI